MKKNIEPEGSLDGGAKLLDGLKDLLIIYGKAGRIIYANGTACRALGCSRAWLLSRTIGDIVAPPYNRLLKERIKRLKAEGELFAVTAYKRRTGILRVEARYSVSALGGRPCVICLARPLPQGVKNAPAVWEPREHYRRLIEGLKDEYFFYQHGVDGVFAYISPSVKNVLGYTPADFLKHYTRYLTANPVNREVTRHTRESIKGRQQPPYRLEITHKDGSHRWLEVLEVPGRGENGRVAAVEGIAHDITGRVKAHEELEKYRSSLEELVEERTAELKAIFDRTPVLMVLLDEKLKVLRTNSSSHPGSLIGEVLNCVNGKKGKCGRGRLCGRCQMLGAIKGTLRSGKPLSRAEANIETAGGGKVYFLLSTAVIKAGGQKQLLLCLDDITSQKEAEESLRKAEEFRRLVLSAVGDGIIGADNEGKILFMNEAAQAMLGWTLEELKDKKLHSIVHYKRPDGRVYPASECPMFAAYTEKKESVVQDEMLWRRDGSGFYVRYSARPMYNKGEVSGAVVTFSDMTERHHVENELREHRERLQTQNAALTELGRVRKTAVVDIDAAFQEAAHTAASAIDADSVSVWLFNEDRSALICRVSYDKNLSAESPCLNLPAADYPAYLRLLESERLLAVEDAATDFRVRELRDSYIKPRKAASLLYAAVQAGNKTAGVICAERRGLPRPWLLDEQNMLGAVADFAALALAGAEKDKLESMKDFLTQTIVHDLKNPLFSIILAGQLLSEEVGRKLTAQQADTLAILNSQATEMKRLVSNILDINRIEEGKLPIKPELFHPEKLLREAAASLRMAAASEKKHVKIKTSAMPPQVTGDTELLRRVAENLLANALKFSPEGAVVEAGGRLSADGKNAEFYVRDSGPGIPAEYHARIFEKFVQLEDPGPRKWGGKGLGLAFCKLAVEAHGGRIWVESIPGHGSVFIFSLPRPHVV